MLAGSVSSIWSYDHRPPVPLHQDRRGGHVQIKHQKSKISGGFPMPSQAQVLANHRDAVKSIRPCVKTGNAGDPADRTKQSQLHPPGPFVVRPQGPAQSWPKGHQEEKRLTASLQTKAIVRNKANCGPHARGIPEWGLGIEQRESVMAGPQWQARETKPICREQPVGGRQEVAPAPCETKPICAGQAAGSRTADYAKQSQFPRPAPCRARTCRAKQSQLCRGT